MGENICEKTCSVFGPSVSFCSASAKNFHFGASLFNKPPFYKILLGLQTATIFSSSAVLILARIFDLVLVYLETKKLNSHILVI